MALRVHAALLFVQLAFAALPVTAKLIFATVSPFALAWVRVLGGALFFGALLRWRGGPQIPRPDLLRIAGCGLLGMAANQLLYLGGLERTGAINASVLVTTIPVFTLLFAVASGRQVLRRAETLGVALAFAGVLSLVGVERAQLGRSFLGDAMIVLNCASYAAFLVLVRSLSTRYGSLPTVAIGFAAASIAVAPFGAPSVPTLAHASSLTWLLIAYVVAIPTCASYLINTWALAHATSSQVAIYIYLQPVVGVALAAIVLGEPVDWRVVASVVTVLLGISLVVWRPSAFDPSLPESEG